MFAFHFVYCVVSLVLAFGLDHSPFHPFLELYPAAGVVGAWVLLSSLSYVAAGPKVKGNAALVTYIASAAATGALMAACFVTTLQERDIERDGVYFGHVGAHGFGALCNLSGVMYGLSLYKLNNASTKRE